MALKDNIKPWQLYAFIVLSIVDVVILITGIVLITTCNEVRVDSTVLLEYSKCPDKDINRCTDSISPCICKEKVEIHNDLLGNVTMYYELETFMQNNESYVKSRDNKQLAGELSLEPSSDCGDFRYVDTSTGRMPIAPCGAIADSMFNDTLLLITSEDDYVPSLTSGMLSEEDKKGFHNPPGDSLEIAFKNFTKPKSWQRPVWDLDKSRSNNGFENEAFIAWMRTDWKRKPMWRINHTDKAYKNGLPKGNYTMRITYAYPASLYSGPRTLIAENVHNFFNSSRNVGGIICLVIGSILLVALTICAIYVYYKERFTFTGIYQNE